MKRMGWALAGFVLFPLLELGTLCLLSGRHASTTSRLLMQALDRGALFDGAHGMLVPVPPDGEA